MTTQSKRITVHSLITEDLGYCCEYAFFTLYRRPTQISERLGVTRRAVQKHKAAVREGCSVCEGKANCLKR